MKAASDDAPGEEPHDNMVWLPVSLKQKIRDGLVALSMANLCFIGAWFTMLYDQDYGFFNRLPVMPPALLALLVNILGLAAVIWLAMCLRRRFPSRTLRLGLHLAFLALLLIPADFFRVQVFQISSYQIIHFFKQPMVMVGTAALLALVVWRHSAAAKVVAVLVGILVPLAFLTISKSMLLCMGLLHLSQDSINHNLLPPEPVSGEHPRVVWLIFDATDYRLAFEQRPAGVSLPEFDRLRKESLFCVNACSPGNCTLGAMPSLISGRRISDISVMNSTDLNCVLADTKERTTWSRMPSVFAEAQALGVNTALIGWYLPYDRVLGDGLNYCEWYPFPTFEPARARTFITSLKRQIGCMAWTWHYRRFYKAICQQGLQRSLALVTNATYGLILLHLPPPHLPGVFIPEKKEYATWGKSGPAGYFNNLALADFELGKLRQAMEANGEWDKTWLIISADHSWSAAGSYDGQHDTRVPFIVKPPGKNEAITYSPAINTVLTHDLILAILRGQITGQPDMAPWINKQGKPLPTLITGKQE